MFTVLNNILRYLCSVGSAGYILLYVPIGEQERHQHQQGAFFWTQSVTEDGCSGELGSCEDCMQSAVQQGEAL